MKKKFIITFAFVTLLALVFFSCRQDIGNLINPEAGISIADAQSWYESNKPQGVQLGFAKVKASKGKLNGKPDWKHAYKVDHPDFTTVQVPLSVQGSFCFVTPERQKAFEDTGDKRYIESLTQMVVVNDKKTGKNTGFLMTIIPDKEYQESTNFKPFYSSYKKWQKGYSGLIFYHTLEGKFTNGWRFANGEVTRSITPKDDSGIDLQLKVPAAQKASSSYDCTDYYYQIWSQDCTDWYTQSESYTSYNGTTCGSWYQDGYQYAYTECYYSGGGGGSEAGGGGSGGTTITSTTVQVSNPPCANLLAMSNDTDFKSEMLSLYISTNMGYEIEKFLDIDSSNKYNFQTSYGGLGSGGVNGIYTGNLDAVIHSHYDGILPIFSVADIESMYEIYKEGNMKNTSTFQSILVTSEGVYSLAITDLSKFAAFSEDITNTLGISCGIINTDYANNITPTTSAEIAVEKFTRFLNNHNTGLSLIVTDMNFGSVANKTVGSNNTVQTTNCN